MGLDMSLGRPLPTLELTAEERRELSGFAASRSLPHSLVARAQLVLWSAEGVANATQSRRWPTFTPPRTAAYAALHGLVLHRRS